MSLLFSPCAAFPHLRNRIFVSPMCPVSPRTAFPTMASRAPGQPCRRRRGAGHHGGASVSPAGASRLGCGHLVAQQVEAWKPIAAFIKAQGAVPGIQSRTQGARRLRQAVERASRWRATPAAGAPRPSDVPFGDYRRRGRCRGRPRGVRGRLPPGCRPRAAGRLRGAEVHAAHATSCTSSSRRSPTFARTSSAAPSPTACASRGGRARVRDACE